MDIRADDLQGEAIKALLRLHLDAMYQHSPPECARAGCRSTTPSLHHVLDSLGPWRLAGLRALKRLSPDHGEIKSMRTADAHLRKGVARALLRHIESAARAQGMGRLSLETGSTAPFAAALRLYASEGFVNCGPFADYTLDPFSVFMTKLLADQGLQP